MAMIVNREGKTIHVWKSSDGLRINGCFPTHWRVSGSGDGWTLWDPPGGPCITTGMQLGDLHEDFKGLIAERIHVEEDGSILVKCSSMTLTDYLKR
jgi:hypothetical protein